jgi:hypothetical protein
MIMALSPKELKNKIDERRAAEKLQEERLLVIEQHEKELKNLALKAKKEEIQSFYSDVAAPIVEAAIEGMTSAHFLYFDFDRYSKLLGYGEFGVEDLGAYSIEGLEESEEFSGLCARYGLSSEDELVKLNKLIDELADEIDGLIKEQKYYAEAEKEAYDALFNLHFAHSPLLNYKMDKVDQLEGLQEVLRSHDDSQFNAICKKLRYIWSRYSEIQDVIDVANGIADKYRVTEVSWAYQYEEINPAKLRFDFFRADVMNWISQDGNPLFRHIFDQIESSIEWGKKTCGVEFNQFSEGFSTLHTPEGIWLEDEELKITFENLLEIFQCLGYEPSISVSKDLTNEADNLIKTHTLKLKWKFT